MSVSTSVWLHSTRSWPVFTAGLFMLSVAVANVGNYAFNSWVARALSPAQFGTYAVVFAVITIGAVPINVMRLAIVKETAAAFGSRRSASPEALFVSLRRHTAGRLSALLPLLLVIGLATFLFARGAGHTPAMAVLALLILAAMILVYAGRGFLQGSLRLESMSLSVFTEHLLRLFIFGTLIFLSVSSEIPLIAILVGLLGSWMLTSRLLRSDAQGQAVDGGRQDAVRRLAATTTVFLIVYVAHTALFSADLIFAGSFLSSAELGEYAALSLAGRIILFANLGVAELVLPLAARPRESAPPLVKRSMLLGAAVPLPVVLAYVLFPDQSLSILFGSGVAGMAEYLPVLGIAMYILSLAGILLSFLLARGLGRYAATVAVGAAFLEILLFLARHADVAEIVSDVLIASVVYALALTAVLVGTVMLPRKVKPESCGTQ